MKKSALFLAPILVLLLSGWGLWGGEKDETPDGLTLYGNVDIRQLSLAFDASGRIIELPLDEGDKVKKGDVVGKLDTRVLDIQIKQAEAQMEAQRQSILKLRNGSRPEEIAQIRAQLASAVASAKRTGQNLERARHLKSKPNSVISETSFEEAETNDKVAKAKVDQLRASLQLAEKGSREEEIAAAEAQLKSLEASLDLLKLSLEKTELISPTDAIVRSRLHEVGEIVSSSLPVYTLALTDPKWIRVYVNEVELGKIKPGMRVSVTTDSSPDRPISGRVGYISSVAEFTPKAVQTEELRTSLVYETRIIVDDPGNALRLGQPASVHVSLGGR